MTVTNLGPKIALVVWYPYSGVDKLLQALRQKLPHIEIREWSDQANKADIHYAVVWSNPPKDELKKFPSLRCIFSMYAGVEHIVNDPSFANIPIAHLIDKVLTQGMTEYVVQNVLLYHRRHPEFADQQRNGLWKNLHTPISSERNVGIMGLGALGSDAAKALIALDFSVSSWSRTPKSMAGLTSYFGPEGLSKFLSQTEILVCLLPLTPATTSILNRDLFSQLPRGAYLINAGRGSSQIEEDILSALDNGQLAGASLDVFETEPLPAEHPFWKHPKVLITPHNASETDIDSAIETIAANILGFESGKPIEGLVDQKLGY